MIPSRDHGAALARLDLDGLARERAEARYLCVHCNAPRPLGVDGCAECERRAANAPEAQLAALRAQLAAVTAERDALHAAVRTLADAQLACDAADDSYARAEADAALDNASIALFVLVPAEAP